MKQSFATSWKASVQPRKQRKYVYNAPLHTRSKLMSSHLSKELKQKYNARSVSIRKGDKVKVVVGQFSGTIGKVVDVDRNTLRIFVEGAIQLKADGSKKQYPIHPSNVVVIELDTSDKKRFASTKSSEKKSEPKPKATPKETKKKPAVKKE